MATVNDLLDSLHSNVELAGQGLQGSPAARRDRRLLPPFLDDGFSGGFEVE
jgi:hypothetical protein